MYQKFLLVFVNCSCWGCIIRSWYLLTFLVPRRWGQDVFGQPCCRMDPICWKYSEEAWRHRHRLDLTVDWGIQKWINYDKHGQIWKNDGKISSPAKPLGLVTWQATKGRCSPRILVRYGPPWGWVSLWWWLRALDLLQFPGSRMVHVWESTYFFPQLRLLLCDSRMFAAWLVISEENLLGCPTSRQNLLEQARGPQVTCQESLHLWHWLFFQMEKVDMGVCYLEDWWYIQIKNIVYYILYIFLIYTYIYLHYHEYRLFTVWYLSVGELLRGYHHRPSKDFDREAAKEEQNENLSDEKKAFSSLKGTESRMVITHYCVECHVYFVTVFTHIYTVAFDI